MESSRNQVCPLCISPFRPADVSKLQNYAALFKRTIINAARNNDIAQIAELVELKACLEEDYFQEIFLSAIEGQSQQVSQYLRRIYESLPDYRKEPLILKIFTLQTDFAISWIAGSFSEPILRMDRFMGLDLNLVKFLIESKKHLELFWIYSREFKSLPSDVQLETAKIFYQAEKDCIIFCRKGDGSGNYTAFITSLLWRNESSACHILSVIFPTLIREDIKKASETYKSSIASILNICHLSLTVRSCGQSLEIQFHNRHSHIWDAVKIAISHNDTAFLRALLDLNICGWQMPFKYKEIAELVIGSKHPEEIKSMLETKEPFASSKKWRIVYCWVDSEHASCHSSSNFKNCRVYRFAKFLVNI